MIEKVLAYKSSDGKCVGSIEEVQKHELMEIVKAGFGGPNSPNPCLQDGDVKACVNAGLDYLIGRRDEVVDILTTGPRSKPKARGINGGTKKRKAKVAEAELPGTETK